MLTDNTTVNPVRLTVRVDKEVAERLRRMAEKQNRSLSSLLRDAVTGVLMFEEHPDVMDLLKGMPDMLKLGIEALATPSAPGDATDSLAKLLAPSPQADQERGSAGSSSAPHELSNDEPLRYHPKSATP